MQQPVSREILQFLGFRHIIDVSSEAFGPSPLDYDEAARLAGGGATRHDVEAFPRADATGWGMYVKGDGLPPGQVALCAYLIWRDRGIEPAAALAEATASYAAREAEWDAYAVDVGPDSEPDLPLTEAEHAYWDRMMAEAEAHAGPEDRH